MQRSDEDVLKLRARFSAMRDEAKAQLTEDRGPMIHYVAATGAALGQLVDFIDWMYGEPHTHIDAMLRRLNDKTKSLDS